MIIYHCGLQRQHSNLSIVVVTEATIQQVMYGYWVLNKDNWVQCTKKLILLLRIISSFWLLILYSFISIFQNCGYSAMTASHDLCHIDVSVQGCSNSSALAMDLQQSCTKPSIWQMSQFMWLLSLLYKSITLNMVVKWFPKQIQCRPHNGWLRAQFDWLRAQLVIVKNSEVESFTQLHKITPTACYFVIHALDF